MEEPSFNTNIYLLPTGSEEREVFGVGSIPVAILASGRKIRKLLHNNCIA